MFLSDEKLERQQFAILLLLLSPQVDTLFEAKISN